MKKADIHELRQNRFWAPYPDSSRELLRDFFSLLQDTDSEVVLSTARKAACLLDAARLARLWTPSALHVSDRALEFPAEWIVGKRVTVVDDVVGTGKTLHSVISRCEKLGAAEIRVLYVATKPNWSRTLKLVKELHPRVEIEARPAVADGPSLVREIVNSISAIPRPYNVDWPLFAGWKLSAQELDWLASDPDWKIRHLSAGGRNDGPRLVTLEATPPLRRALSLATGIDEKLIALSKVRMYLEPIEEDCFNVTVLGLCSLNALSPDDQAQLSDRFSQAGVTTYGTVRVAQYEISAVLARHLLDRGEAHLEKGLMVESSWQRNLCFGPGFSADRAEINAELVPLRTREPSRYRISADKSRLVRNSLISAMQRDSISSPYHLARADAREGGEAAHKNFLNNTPRRESFSFSDLVELAQKEVSELSGPAARAEVSSLLDDAVDSGATVPGFAPRPDGGIERVFRAGETIRFSQREQGLLTTLLEELLYEGDLSDLRQPANQIGKTFLEKSLVLAVRYAVERTGFVEVMDRAAAGVPTLTVSFSRHGSILDFRRDATPRPVADAQTITFGAFLEKRQILKWRGQVRRGGKWAELREVPNVPADENSAFFRGFGLALAEVFKNGLVTNSEMEAIGTLCNERQHAVALLAEIERIQGFLQRVCTGVSTGDLTKQGFGVGLRADSDVGISIRAMFSKLEAIANATAIRAATRVSGQLGRHDRIVWDDVVSQVFIGPTPESVLLTRKAALWAIQMCAALDELRIELRSSVSVLPTSSQISDVAERFGLAYELIDFRTKFGARRTGIERFGVAFGLLADEADNLSREIDFYFDSDCLLVAPERYYHVVVIRSGNADCKVCDELRLSAEWRNVIPLPMNSFGPGYHAFVILNGQIDTVVAALVEITTRVQDSGPVVVFRSVADSERVLHQQISDRWLTRGFSVRLQESMAVIGSTPGVHLYDGRASEGNRLTTYLREESVPMEVSHRRQVDLVLLCATTLEWGVLQREIFDNAMSEPRGVNMRHVLVGTADAFETEISIAAVCPSDQGSEEMLSLVSDAFDEFDPSVVALVGIAGGVDDELSIGDVVVANSVLRYERGKVMDGEISHDLISSNLPVTSLNHLTGLVGNASTLLDGTHSVRMGSYAAGEKVLADEFSDLYQWLLKTTRKLQVVEMESGGFFKGLLSSRSALSSNAFWFVAKGVSDKASAETMGGPEGGPERDAWEESRRQDQLTATRRSIETAILVTALHLKSVDSA